MKRDQLTFKKDGFAIDTDSWEDMDLRNTKQRTA